MAQKNKNEEVIIIETDKDSDTVTDLQVLIGEKVIGEISQNEGDRHYQVNMMNNQKATALSIEAAVQTILADYNLHNKR